MRAIDVMGFAGGFTLGTVQAGFELVGKREMPGGFGVPNCEANRHLLGDGWTAQVGSPESWEGVADVAYVFGNPPCSGFSLLSSKGFRGVDSPINHCMWAFAGFVAKTRPLVAAFESVTQAFTQGITLMRSLHAKLVEDTGIPYRLYHVKHNNLAVGGVAIRKRYFWVVSQVPFGVEHPTLDRTPVLWDAIGDLEHAPVTWELQPRRAQPSWWAEREVAHGDTFDGHFYQVNPEFQRAMDLLPVAEPWEYRKTISYMARRYYELKGELPESWARNGAKYIAKNFENMGYHQLIRWDPHQPARVITGGAMYAILHPTQYRLFTHREVARVMGFPDDWRVLPLKPVSNLRLTWGKGIPVTSGRWLSHWVKRSINGQPGSITGEPTDEGKMESIIDVTKVITREEVNNRD